jgi:hypothetical protein
VKEVDQVFDLVWLENVAESRHSSSTVVNLMLDPLFVEAFADGTKIWSTFTAAAICAMAVLTPLFMKERGSGVLTLARIGVNSRSGRSWQAARQGYDNHRETGGDTDSHWDFEVSLQRNKCLSAMIHRGWRSCS